MSTHLDSLIELMSSIPIPSFAAGRTAAALHRLDGYTLRPPFQIMIERGHNVARVGHRVHTTTALDLIDRGWAQGVPVLSPARTLLHLAEFESLPYVVRSIDSAVRDGLVSDDFLHRRLVALRRRGRGGVQTLTDALDEWEGGTRTESWLEREYLRVTRSAGLPTPLTQRNLSKRNGRLVRVDCHYAGTRVVVELLGYRWHRSEAQMRIDAERYNALLLDGYLPFQFTYRQVVETPAAVISQVGQALMVGQR